jgi:hypothetical protein
MIERQRNEEEIVVLKNLGRMVFHKDKISVFPPICAC